jgi:hypothetical protein
MIVFARSFYEAAGGVEEGKSRIGRGKIMLANRRSMGEEGLLAKLYHPFLEMGRIGRPLSRSSSF